MNLVRDCFPVCNLQDKTICWCCTWSKKSNWVFWRGSSRVSEFISLGMFFWIRFCTLGAEIEDYIVAFVKERVHNAVEIDILGIFRQSFIVTNLAPRKILQGQILQGQMTSLQSTMCFVCLTFSFMCQPLFRIWYTCLSNSGQCFLAGCVVYVWR